MKAPTFVAFDYNDGIGTFTSTQDDDGKTWKKGDLCLAHFITYEDVTIKTSMIQLDRRKVANYWSFLFAEVNPGDGGSFTFQLSKSTMFAEITVVYRGADSIDVLMGINSLTLPQAGVAQPNERAVMFYGMNMLTNFVPPAKTNPRFNQGNSDTPGIQFLVADQDLGSGQSAGAFTAKAQPLGDPSAYLVTLIGK